MSKFEKFIKMEAIKLKGIAHKGSLTLKVPQQFDERELEVIIFTSEGKEYEKNINNNQQHKNKVEELMRIVGSAKHPDFPITKYDVYDQ